MNPHHLKQAIGSFSNQEEAEQALLALQSLNFPMHQIAVVTKNPNATENSTDKADEPPLTRVEGAKAGAILAGVGVGFTTLTLGLGILFVPGVGPVLAIDSILTTFFGSGVASAAGGLYGAVLGCLDPEKQVELYRAHFQEGDYLIIIEATENQILAVEPILRRCGLRSWQVHNLPKT